MMKMIRSLEKKSVACGITQKKTRYLAFVRVFVCARKERLIFYHFKQKFKLLQSPCARGAAVERNATVMWRP